MKQKINNALKEQTDRLKKAVERLLNIPAKKRRTMRCNLSGINIGFPGDKSFIHLEYPKEMRPFF